MPKTKDPATTAPRRRKRLLSSPRRVRDADPAADAYRELLHLEVAQHLRKLAMLDEALEKMHVMVQDLMVEAKSVVGIEWVTHRTRPGLHPVLCQRKGAAPARPFVGASGNIQVRRPWAFEVRPGFLRRYADCMAGQEALALPYLEEAFDMIRLFSEERQELLKTLGAVRRLLTKRRAAGLPGDLLAAVADFESRSVRVRDLLFARANT